MVNDNIWHLWCLDVPVDSETMLSISVLAHIYAYDSEKTGTIGFAKRDLSVLLRARNTCIQFKPQFEYQL